MILTTDIANILYKDCQRFGLKVYKKGVIPQGINDERIIINAGLQQSGTYFKASFVNVNFVVPNKDSGNANTKRLNELEHLGATLESSGWLNDFFYRYSPESIQVIEDEDLKSYFVNVRLLFEVLNVKK